MPRLPRLLALARRLLVPICAAVLLVASGGVPAFSFDDVAKRAAALAAASYKQAPPNLPKPLQALDYAQFRDIRFRPEASYWRGARLPFELQFFHQGLYYDRPARINEVSSEGVREMAKLGLAPLTSMYFFGEMQRPADDDYWPEVHDTDGLSIETGTGEWIWRPLTNPRRLLVTSFAVNNPQGFGLQQRDRRARREPIVGPSAQAIAQSSS